MTDPRTEAGRVQRAATALRERGDQSREAEGEGRFGASRPGTAGTHAAGATAGSDASPALLPPWRSRASQVRRLHRRFADIRLDERFHVTDTRVAGCGVLCVTHHLDICPPDLPGPSEARAAALARLELVFGVGGSTAARLRADGIASVDDLAGLAGWRDAAADVLTEWERGDLAAIGARMTRRLGGHGHLLSSVLCGLVDLGDVVFLDLETLGFWNNMVFLAGVGRFGPAGFSVKQFLAPGCEDERGVLALAGDELAGARVVVTFNGRTADLPWLAGRSFYHGLPAIPEPVHVDLSYGVRRRFRLDADVLPDARLTTVQRRLLGLERPETDIPGWLVPDLYEYYAAQADRRQGILVPVVDHNRSDLEALAVLLGVLCGEVRAPV